MVRARHKRPPFLIISHHFLLLAIISLHIVLLPVYVHDEQDGLAVALARVGDHAQAVVVGHVDLSQRLHLWVVGGVVDEVAEEVRSGVERSGEEERKGRDCDSGCGRDVRSGRGGRQNSQEEAR